MKKKYIFVLSGCVIFIFATQFSGNLQSTELSITQIPNDFEYDGCSLFPDMDMLDCCTEHDKTYFFGGTWQERLRTDNDFYYCIAEKGHIYSPLLGATMWTGVRIGGAPIWPTSFRWGFGRDVY